MGWARFRSNVLSLTIVPFILLLFLFSSGGDFSNCTNYMGGCFAPVDELAFPPQQNESEFQDVDEYLNITETPAQNETIIEDSLPDEESKADDALSEPIPPTEEPDAQPEETEPPLPMDEPDAQPEETEPPIPPVEPDETGCIYISGQCFLPVNDSAFLANETSSGEFQDVEEFLNITQEENTTAEEQETPVLPLPPEGASAEFMLVNAHGKSVGASITILKDGKELSRSLQTAGDAKSTPFGVPPGKYDIALFPSLPDQAKKDGTLPIPVSRVLMKEVLLDSSSTLSLRMEGLPPSATPFGKNTKQAYAIDPTDFDFTQGELTVVAKGSELYKCAEWEYHSQTCTGKWLKIMDLSPGEEYTVLFNSTDPAYAEYNATYGTPVCANYTSPCIANSSLLRSRDSIGGTQEPNQPNTIDACTDGTAGSYLSDESIENITIASLTPPYNAFNTGDLVQVNATVHCWGTGASNNINFVYTADADSPSWTVANFSATCPGGGFQQVSRTFTLENSVGFHAVRVVLQYNGNTGATCGTGAYDDNDDVVFLVNGTTPAVNLVSPPEGGLVCEGIEQFTFNVTEGSSCRLYINGALDRPIVISASADTNYAFNASLLSGANTWQVICGAISSEVRNVTQCSRKTIFEDTFTSAGGFTPSAPNTAPWERGNATQVDGCHRDSSCWGTGLSANYVAAGPYDDFLTKSVSMDLSNYDNVTLAFYHYRHFENPATMYDAGVVEINNGTGWVRITPEGGYTGTVATGWGNSLANQQAYGNHGPGWELEVFNISAYSGQDDVTLRLYFAADSTVNDRGWFVDDVKVFGDPQIDYGIISVWDTSDTQTVTPGQNNTFYANYSYFNGTPIPGPSGTCNITTNETFQMSYNSATGIYEFNQSFPSETSGTFIVTCQLNSSFIQDSKSGSYEIIDVKHTNLSCWEFQDPVTPAYPGGYNQMFLFCNYSYLNDTPVNSNGVCTWQDETYIEYYFFGQETFNIREVAFFGEKQLLYSFGGVWSELNATRGHGKVACYNETQGTMVVHMCLNYLNASQDVNLNLNNSNSSINCFPVGTMDCGQFTWMSGVPKGTFAWATMDLNMTDFYNTLSAIGSPYLVDMQFTYECPNCSYSLYTTPYNVSDYPGDLIALHRFDGFVDNGTANVSVDAAGNLNLTRHGTVDVSPGQVNNAFNFSDYGGYLYTPDRVGFDILEQITVEAYIKLDYHVPKERVIMSKWAYSPVYACGPGMNESCINQRSGRVFLDKSGHLTVQLSHNGLRSGTVTLRDPEKVPPGEWVHAGFVFNGTTIRLYRNSVVVAETEKFSGYRIYDSTSPWVVGADDAGYHGHAEGMLIDELRVLKRGLEDWEFVSHANSNFWLIKSQPLPSGRNTFVSETLSGDKRNFTRTPEETGENLVKLSVLGQALNMSFNSTTGLYTGHRAVPYGFHPGTYTINYSCSKTGAEPQSLLSDWDVYASAPTCSIDGYLSEVPLGSFQYVNWSVNSNVPPIRAYYNITHSDGTVFSFHNIRLINGSTYVNHAPGVAEITCYVENANSSYSSTSEFNITGPTECFYATGENAVYVLAANLTNTKEDSACITVEAHNVTIDCAGHSVAGEGEGYGFLVYGRNGTTLKNCNISSYHSAIQWIDSNHGEMRNNSLSNSTHGIYMDPSYNNTIIENQFFNNSMYGLYLEDSHNNTIRNNTVYNNSQAGFLLEDSTRNLITGNHVYNNTNEGILLLRSDYNIVNDTFSQSNFGRGIRLWESSYNNITNNRMVEDFPTFQFRNGSSHNRIINNTASGSISFGVRIFLDSINNTFIDNSFCNNTREGIQIESRSHNNSFYGNTVFNSSHGVNITNSDGTYFYGNNLSNNTVFGIYLSNSHNTSIISNEISYNGDDGVGLENSHNNSIFSSSISHNGLCGIDIDSSENTTLSGNQIFNNSQEGVAVREANTTSFSGDRFAGNGIDLYVISSFESRNLSLLGVLFLPPSGLLENYTNLSIIDMVDADSEYTINWAANSSTLPPDYISFAQKFINISTLAGTSILDEITWHWDDSELPGYNENYFELWKYNASGWEMLNNTPNTSVNTLTLYNMNPESDYGILQRSEFLFIENLTLNPNLSIDHFDNYNYTVDVINSSTIDTVNLTYTPINGDGGSCHAFYVNGSCAEDSPTTVLMGYLSGNTWYRPNIRPDNIYPQVQFADDEIYWYNSPSFVDIYRFNYHIFHFINNYTINSNASFWIEFDARSKPTTNTNIQVYLFDNTTTISDFQSNWLGNPKGELVATIGPDTPKHHAHTTNSTHYLVTLTADASGNIGTTSRPVNGNFWIVLYSTTTSSGRAWNLSIRDGSFCNTTNWWTGTNAGWGTTQVLTGCPDVHLHVARYTGGINDGVNATSCANLTSGLSNCTSTVDYFGDIPNLPPVPNDITNPVDNSTHFCPLNITWNQFIDPNGDAVTYNVSLLDANGTFIQTIVGSTSDTYYNWDCSGIPNGIYKINVKGTDTGGLSSNTTMDGNFTLFSNCPIIELPGTYQMKSDFTGAPNNASPLTDYACVKIASSDVVFDCNGHNITDNGTAYSLTSYGILINGSHTNTSIRNCIVSNYTHGIYSFEANNSHFYNNTASNNSAMGIALHSSHHNLLEGNTAHENRAGFVASGASNTSFANNSAYNNTENGFEVYFSSGNTFNRISAYQNADHGLIMAFSSGNKIEDSSFHENSGVGALLATESENNSLSNISAFLNGAVGFVILDNSSGNNITYSQAYENGLIGFAMLSLEEEGCTGNLFAHNLAYENNPANQSFGDIPTGGFILYNLSSGNFLINNTAYENNLYGFILHLDASNNTLASNNAYNNTFDGFSISYSQNNTLQYNYAWNNARHGYSVISSSENNLSENSAHFNLVNGFILTQGTLNRLYGNNATHSGSHGFLLTLSSENNTLEGNIAHSHAGGGANSGFHLYQSRLNNLTSNTAYNNTQHGFFIQESSFNNITSNTAYNNTQHGFFIQESSFNNISSNAAYNNTYDGIQLLIEARNNTLAGNTLHNNSQNGLWLYANSSGNAISGNIVYNNSFNGIHISANSSKNLLSMNNVSGHAQSGLVFDPDVFSNTAYENRVCFNSVDISNFSTYTTGAMGTCDTYFDWSENNHPGCTFRCTDIWHYFYGDVNGSLILAPNQADIFYSWLWKGEEGKIYAVRGGAGIQWDSLFALGRNTSQQNSTNDFTELDSLLGISAFPDNVNETFSYDGSNPWTSANATVYGLFVPYIPVANVSLFDPSLLFGIMWDSSQGGPEFNTTLNQDVVFATEIDGTQEYAYEIRVPETLATYKGGNVIEFWVELD